MHSRYCIHHESVCVFPGNQTQDFGIAIQKYNAPLRHKVQQSYNQGRPYVVRRHRAPCFRGPRNEHEWTEGTNHDPTHPEGDCEQGNNHKPPKPSFSPTTWKANEPTERGPASYSHWTPPHAWDTPGYNI